MFEGKIKHSYLSMLGVRESVSYPRAPVKKKVRYETLGMLKDVWDGDVNQKALTKQVVFKTSGKERIIKGVNTQRREDLDSCSGKCQHSEAHRGILAEETKKTKKQEESQRVWCPEG